MLFFESTDMACGLEMLPSWCHGRPKLAIT
jgi:hypothetical protein